MRKSFLAPLAALLVTAGIATAGSIPVKDGTGAQQSLLTFAFSGAQAYALALIDTTGAQVDPATKQGQTSMVQALGAVTDAAATTTDVTASSLIAQSKQQSGKLGTLAATVGSDGAPTTPAQTVQPSASSRFDTVVRSTSTDIGASVAANAATTLVAATATRRGFSIQNQTAGACYLSGVAAATPDFHGLLIASGAYYESKDSHVGTGALSVICTQAGGVYARQW